MMIRKDVFFGIFGAGRPNGDSDLEAMEYGHADDRRALLALARCTAPGTVVEFGVCDGLTARMLLDEIPGIEAYVGIDLPARKAELPALEDQRGEKPRVAGALVKDDKRVRIVRKRSETLTSADLPKADLVYIDGGHDYETLAADTRLARELLNPGGVVVWHDYHNPETPDVNRVIDELCRAEGDHVCLVEGTWICFELHRGEG